MEMKFRINYIEDMVTKWVDVKDFIDKKGFIFYTKGEYVKCIDKKLVTVIERLDCD